MRSHRILCPLISALLTMTVFFGLLTPDDLMGQARQNTTTIRVIPSDNIQTLVDKNSSGTTFFLTKGVYRMQSIRPKANDAFIGEPGAILSGARLLTAFSKQGQYWVAHEQEQQGQRFGRCETHRVHPPVESCMFPEDLFIDDAPLTQVIHLSDLGAGKWHFDYTSNKLFMADDPTGKKVETSVTSQAFEGSAPNVLIQGLIIEKYASPGEEGAIHGQTGHAGLRSSHWTIQDNEVRWNHAIGIRLGDEMRVLRNNIHSNGQLGIGGSGTNILVERNKISNNNTMGFDWHTAGGTKFVETHNLIIRNNFVNHNYGPGLWTDLDNVNTLYENNRVIQNKLQGIFHEVSYSAIIRNNIVEKNGFGQSIWHVGSGILVSSSPNVEIYGNTVSYNADGIGIIQDHTRIQGKFGPHEIENVYVHDNIITMAEGHTGIGVTNSDPVYVTARNNRFENNTYILIGPEYGAFKSLSVNYTIEGWRQFGQDLNSNVIRRQ